jgi:hypothetical protein
VVKCFYPDDAAFETAQLPDYGKEFPHAGLREVYA